MMPKKQSSFDFKGARILAILGSAEGPSNKREIANKLDVGVQYISRSINLMIEENLVVEINCVLCPHCGKKIDTLKIGGTVKPLQLTPKGREVALLMSEAMTIVEA